MGEDLSERLEKMTDGRTYPNIAETVRNMAKLTTHCVGTLGAQAFTDAADEIDRLRAALAAAEAERDRLLSRIGGDELKILNSGLILDTLKGELRRADERAATSRRAALEEAAGVVAASTRRLDVSISDRRYDNLPCGFLERERRGLDEIVTAIRALIDQPAPVAPRWRHKKRGTTYTEIECEGCGATLLLTEEQVQG